MRFFRLTRTVLKDVHLWSWEKRPTCVYSHWLMNALYVLYKLIFSFVTWNNLLSMVWQDITWDDDRYKKSFVELLCLQGWNMFTYKHTHTHTQENVPKTEYIYSIYHWKLNIYLFQCKQILWNLFLFSCSTTTISQEIIGRRLLIFKIISNSLSLIL